MTPLSLTRRQFLKRSSVLSSGLALSTQAASLLAANSPNDKIMVAVMGTNGRGLDHIAGFLSQPNVEIAYVCDVDSRAIEKGIAAVLRRQERKPKGVKDVRQLLDDRAVDVLSIATPNHWHAPATILACAAGKHVYVEKPCSHNPREGELMVEAARRAHRIVQMGNQRRSWPWVIEAIQRLHGGEWGRVLFARTWYNNKRPSIGHGQVVPVPDWLDYALWQGAAPERPYKDNLIHYNWHWHWHWGNGELGNNGIHALDVARWGLQADYPTRVACAGGRYQYQDDQETPDVYVSTFDFGDKGATWESHSCHPHGFEGEGFGINFYCDQGCLSLAGNHARIFDLDNKVIGEIKGPSSESLHYANFIDALRTGKQPNSDIAEGAKSSLLCHLGNIAYRTGRTLQCDPKTGHIVGDKEPEERYWSREYRPGWEPKL
jgi:predicted dehydrogenase